VRVKQESVARDIAVRCDLVIGRIMREGNSWSLCGLVAWGHIFIYNLKVCKKWGSGLHSSQIEVGNLHLFYLLNPKISQKLVQF